MRVSLGYLRHLSEIAPTKPDQEFFAEVAEELVELEERWQAARKRALMWEAENQRLRAALRRMIRNSGRLTAADGSSDALFLLLDARTAACELLGIDPAG